MNLRQMLIMVKNHRTFFAFRYPASLYYMELSRVSEEFVILQQNILDTLLPSYRIDIFSLLKILCTLWQ